MPGNGLAASHIFLMPRISLPALIAAVVAPVAMTLAGAGSAFAQLPPGSVGNAGRMPDTMSPGALPPPPTPGPAPVMAPPAPYPNTQSMTRDRIQSQDYRVQRLQQRPDGSWKADVTRDATPTRPQGVPKKVTILPNGQMLEEW